MSNIYAIFESVSRASCTRMEVFTFNCVSDVTDEELSGLAIRNYMEPIMTPTVNILETSTITSGNNIEEVKSEGNNINHNERNEIRITKQHKPTKQCNGRY